MPKIYIIYTERQNTGVLIIKDVPDRVTAEEEVNLIMTAGGSIHKIISGEEFTLAVKSHLIYPDEV